MPTNLTINGNTYPYPSPSDDPGWGAGASGWASEVTTALNDLQSVDDIPETSFNLANNISSPADITGFTFNPATVRGAVLDYTIYRTTNSNEVAEKRHFTNRL
jgi:hypothetical protein